MAEQALDMNLIREEYVNFPDVFQSVLMATVSSDGIPDASYAAYVLYENDYYIYVSELSRHTANLMDTGKVSLLFIEDEEHATHLFARQRVTLECEATQVARDHSHFDVIMDQFQQRFGKFMEMLKKLNDFHLFKISPLQGSYVRGFAQAFKLEGKNLSEVRHMNDRGHKGHVDSTQQ